MTTQYYFDKEQYLKINKAWCDAINNGYQPDASQYMLYNVIRGKHPEHGFAPFKRPSKFYGMGMLNRGAYQAWEHINHVTKWGTRYWKEERDRLIEPFGDTFTIEDLEKIEIPEVEPVWTVYGKGKTLADKIANGELTVNTSEELEQLYNTNFKIIRGIRVHSEEAA